MRLLPIAVVATALASPLAMASPPVPAGGMHAALLEVDPGVEVPVATRFATLDRFHAEHLSAIDPRTLSPVALADAFLATDLLSFYAQFGDAARHRHHVARLAGLHEALAHRGVATVAQTQATFAALVGARWFDDARELKAQFPSALGDRAVPVIRHASGFDPNTEGLLVLQPDGALLATNATRDGMHRVVLLGCSVAERAMDAIVASPALRQAFDGMRTIWLIPADRTADPNVLRRWHARFPDHPVAFAWSNATWRGVEFGHGPSFQLFDGTTRVAHSHGWRKDASVSEALRAVLYP